MKGSSKLAECLHLLVHEVFEHINAVVEVLQCFQQVLGDLMNVCVGFIGNIHDLLAKVAVLLMQPDKSLIILIKLFAQLFVFVI